MTVLIFYIHVYPKQRLIYIPKETPIVDENSALNLEYQSFSTPLPQLVLNMQIGEESGKEIIGIL